MIIEKCLMPDISNKKDKAVNSFIAHSLGGAYLHLPNKTQKLLPLISRLVDKAKNEYEQARYYALEEEKEGKIPTWKIELTNRGQNIYFCSIVNNLENCINSISRLYKSLDRVEPNNNKEVKSAISKIRNSIEHMDERVSLESREGSISLNIFKDGLILELVNDTLSIKDLADELVSLNVRVINLLQKLSST